MYYFNIVSVLYRSRIDNGEAIIELTKQLAVCVCVCVYAKYFDLSDLGWNARDLKHKHGRNANTTSVVGLFCKQHRTVRKTIESN